MIHYTRMNTQYTRILTRIFTLGPALIFIAAVLWGLDGVLRRSLYSVPPVVIVFYEHLIGAIILLPFLHTAWKKEVAAKLHVAGKALPHSTSACIRAFLHVLTPAEWVAVGTVSLLSGLLGTLLFTSALAATQYISFSVVYLLQKLQPLFVMATSHLLLRERFSRTFLVWAGVALVAGYFVTFPYGVVNFSLQGAHSTAFNPHIFAALLAFGAAAAWGTSTAISRYALLHHNTTLITGLRFLITVPLALIALFFFADFSAAINPLTITTSQLGLLCLIACSTGMLALWIYYKGLQKTPASVSAIIELAFPLTAIFVDYVLYNTLLTVPQLLAGAVLLYAAYKVANTNKRAQ
jgi:drug/metabolite transporter (DMT)-like permease